MLGPIDKFLNTITMYRLVLYYLSVILVVAFVLGFFGIVPFDPTMLAFSFVLITGVCWFANKIFAWAFSAPVNTESVYITAFILALIVNPVAATNIAGVGFLIFASVWAIASKFIFAIGNKHIFNPAAFGVALAALTISQTATWWAAGNTALLPFVILGGLLIVKKLQRFDMVLSFGVAALATVVLMSPANDFVTPLVQTLLHSSFFFLAFVMLTEPLTMPPSRLQRVVYGAIVGVLFVPAVHVASFYFTPELALIIGNLFSYGVSPKGRHMLTLASVQKIGTDAYDFAFTPDKPFLFRPGQYLEWTLGHAYTDNRGNRRYFTIASSPTEKEIHLGAKFYEPASTFKRALAEMKIGDVISASHLAGEFVLPNDPTRKLVFIAGGIGITPFRGMIQYLLDAKESRSIALLYGNKTAADIAYKDIFDRARAELGITTVYALSDEKNPPPGTRPGRIDAALIAREVPDYRERYFMISGPHAMVKSFETTLRDMGVPGSRIQTDYFPGFM